MSQTHCRRCHRLHALCICDSPAVKQRVREALAKHDAKQSGLVAIPPDDRKRRARYTVSGPTEDVPETLDGKPLWDRCWYVVDRATGDYLDGSPTREGARKRAREPRF